MTVGVKRKMTDSDHNADDRTLTNSLLTESDYVKYADVKKVQKTTINDWSEAVVGWKSVETSLNVKTSNNPPNVKKKRVVDRAISDLYNGTLPANPGEEFWSNSSSSADYKPGIRCIGDDFESFPIPPWKSNTEQGTYRYVQDNGSYRTIKFMYDDRREWYTVRRKYPEKVSTAWHQNCKRMQREMRRQQRRDINKSDKDRSLRSRSSRSNSGKNSSEANSGDDTSRSNCETMMMPSQPKRPIVSQPIVSQLQPEEQPAKVDNAKPEKPHKRALYRNDVRVKSTKSDGAVQNGKKMGTIHESEPSTPLPQYSIPPGGIFKSASDLFIENFSSRINALEDEIKKDTKLLRKNESDMVKLQNSRLKFREQTRGNLKEPNNSNLVHFSPRMPLKTETLTSDIFSVKSVGTKELKPLEKTKSFNKHSNIHQNGHLFQEHKANFGLQASSISNNSNIPANAIDWDKTVSSYKSSLENTKQALFNTLTGTKIEAQKNNKRSPSKGFSSPSTITICDHGSAISAHSGDHIDSFRQVPVMIDKKSESRKPAPPPMHTVPAILPEISGKRLEVNTISHRLL